MKYKCPDCGYKKESNDEFNLCPNHDYIVHMTVEGLPKPVFNLAKLIINNLTERVKND
jgi:hypothetical protein